MWWSCLGVICAEIAAKKIAAACDAVFLPNPVGCGLNPKDMVVMMDVLSGILANANVYGVLIVGLAASLLRRSSTGRQSGKSQKSQFIMWESRQREALEKP